VCVYVYVCVCMCMCVCVCACKCSSGGGALSDSSIVRMQVRFANASLCLVVGLSMAGGGGVDIVPGGRAVGIIGGTTDVRE
jgi:hypothetical protein